MIESLEARDFLSGTTSVSITSGGQAQIILPNHYSHVEITQHRVSAYDYDGGQTVIQDIGSEDITSAIIWMGDELDYNHSNILTLYNEVYIPIKISGSGGADDISLQGDSRMVSVYGHDGDDYIDNTGLVSDTSNGNGYTYGTWIDGGDGEDTFENENTSTILPNYTNIEHYYQHVDLG